MPADTNTRSNLSSRDALKPAPGLNGDPLFVDLDGTLVSTDMLWESAMLFASRHPFQVWRLPLWLMMGKAHLKKQLAGSVSLDPATLPYRPEILEFLREEKLKGRELILATAADKQIATNIASHTGLFDGVIASDGLANLSAAAKLRAIQDYAKGREFGYIGNATVDLPIWEKAADSYLVACGKRLEQKAGRVCVPVKHFPSDAKPWASLMRALRPHQWVKNLLLLVPLLASHQLGNLKLVLTVVGAFAVFSMCASAVYIVNDLLDISADRRHPRKKLRPFAAGLVPIPVGVITAPAILAAGLTASVIFLPPAFSILLVVYLFLTTAYSFYFKRKLLQDVFLLAALYTLRILAGGAAVSVEISPWLLAFSLFFFLSLAFVKRYSELLVVLSREESQASGRSYITQDIEILASAGPSSGYLAVLVLCLYLNSQAVSSLYRHPAVLWGVTPVLLFWITRIWFLPRRGTVMDDPVVFACTDRFSLVAGCVVGVMFFLAI